MWDFLGHLPSVTVPSPGGIEVFATPYSVLSLAPGTFAAVVSPKRAWAAIVAPRCRFAGRLAPAPKTLVAANATAAISAAAASATPAFVLTVVSSPFDCGSGGGGGGGSRAHSQH